MTAHKLRKQPYTDKGISRVPCARCGRPSTAQWQVCADGNNYRGVCTKCDIGLNAIVLAFMRQDPLGNKIKAYRQNKEN